MINPLEDESQKRKHADAEAATEVYPVTPKTFPDFLSLQNDPVQLQKIKSEVLEARDQPFTAPFKVFSTVVPWESLQPNLKFLYMYHKNLKLRHLDFDRLQRVARDAAAGVRTSAHELHSWRIEKYLSQMLWAMRDWLAQSNQFETFIAIIVEVSSPQAAQQYWRAIETIRNFPSEEDIEILMCIRDLSALLRSKAETDPLLAKALTLYPPFTYVIDRLSAGADIGELISESGVAMEESYGKDLRYELRHFAQGKKYDQLGYLYVLGRYLSVEHFRRGTPLESEEQAGNFAKDRQVNLLLSELVNPEADTYRHVAPEHKQTFKSELSRLTTAAKVIFWMNQDATQRQAISIDETSFYQNPQFEFQTASFFKELAEQGKRCPQALRFLLSLKVPEQERTEWLHIFLQEYQLPIQPEQESFFQAISLLQRVIATVNSNTVTFTQPQEIPWSLLSQLTRNEIQTILEDLQQAIKKKRERYREEHIFQAIPEVKETLDKLSFGQIAQATLQDTPRFILVLKAVMRTIPDRQEHFFTKNGEMLIDQFLITQLVQYLKGLDQPLVTVEFSSPQLDQEKTAERQRQVSDRPSSLKLRKTHPKVFRPAPPSSNSKKEETDTLRYRVEHFQLDSLEGAIAYIVAKKAFPQKLNVDELEADVAYYIIRLKNQCGVPEMVKLRQELLSNSSQKELRSWIMTQLASKLKTLKKF